MEQKTMIALLKAENMALKDTQSKNMYWVKTVELRGTDHEYINVDQLNPDTDNCTLIVGQNLSERNRICAHRNYSGIRR